MSPRGVLHAIGAVVVFVGVAMLAPLGVSLAHGGPDVLAFAISCAVTVAAGALLILATRGSFDLGIRDAFAVVAFGWVAMTLFGSLPFLLSGATPVFVDAVFETTSGFTTTGASILPEVESLPRGVLFWRALVQWIGGMGIILLSLAVLPMLGVGGMQLYQAESPGPSPDKLTPRIRQTAAYLWGVYAALTALETVALKAAGMSWFDAVCHSFTTMATGGYSTRNRSIAGYESPAIEWIVILFMWLAGANFALHYRGMRSPKRYFQDPEWRAYLVVTLGAVALLAGGLYWVHGYDPERGLRGAAFQVVSFMTTTGYATEDVELWHPAMRWVLLLLMLIGGCAGSTAGSIKIVRHLILAKAGLQALRLTAAPRVVRPVTLGRGRRVDDSIVREVLGFSFLYMALLAGGTLALAAFSPDLETALSAAATSLGNVGPGFAAIGPFDNFAWFDPVAKWLLILLMLVGRLEIYTVLVLFLPATWKR